LMELQQKASYSDSEKSNPEVRIPRGEVLLALMLRSDNRAHSAPSSERKISTTNNHTRTSKIVRLRRNVSHLSGSSGGMTMQKESLRDRGGLPIPTTARGDTWMAIGNSNPRGFWRELITPLHQQTSTIERKQTRRNSPPSHNRTINGNTKEKEEGRQYPKRQPRDGLMRIIATLWNPNHGSDTGRQPVSIRPRV
jgi:hypothetical protein